MLKKLLLPLLALLLLSGCGADPYEYSENTVTTAAPTVSREVAGAIPTAPMDGWDIVVRDADNWELRLNVNRTYYNRIKYKGELRYRRYGTTQEVVGIAGGVYITATDTLTICAEDSYRNDHIAYSLTFSGSGTDMPGSWAYEKAANGNSIGATLVKGTIDGRTAPRAAARTFIKPEQYSEKATGLFIEEGE